MSTKLWTRWAAGAALALAAGAFYLPTSRAQSGVPHYEVDPTWPKPLPERWVLGGLGGVCVDAQDHVFILNRQDVLATDLDAGQLAPPVIEIDQAGNVVHSWGDLKDLDPRLHSCHFDKDDNMWIASSPSGMVRKYNHDGSKLLFQMGEKGIYDSADGTEKGRPLNSPAPKFFMVSSVWVDPGNSDIYVSDGESRNGDHRVAVFDKAGTFLRQWDPEGMTTVHCMIVSHDGLVYVCNRENARIQVYDKMGKFRKNIEIPWKPYTPPDGTRRFGTGAAVTIDFSHDPAQKYMYLINQNSAEVEVMDRESGRILSSFGRDGHFPGQFDQPHGLAVDSKGNVFIAENRGKRVQKFKLVGQ